MSIMKKINFLLSAALVATMGIFSSCSSDDTHPVPSVSFAYGGQTGLTSISVVSGATPTISVTVRASAEIKSITAASGPSSSVSTISGYPKTDDFVNDTLDILSITLPAVTAAEVLQITVIDKDDQTTTATLAITVGTSGSLSSENTLTLGAQDNTTGSFAASLNGTVYKTTQVAANVSSIDVIYYYGDTYSAMLAGPAFIVSSSITWGGEVATSVWGTDPYATYFASASDADYTDATYSSVEFTGTTGYAGNLAVGSVYKFYSELTGAYGIAKVTALTTGATGSITFKVKIQE